MGDFYIMVIRDEKAVRSAEVILLVLALSQIVLANSSSMANTIQFQGFYLINKTCAVGSQNVLFNISNEYITIIYNPLVTVPTGIIYPNQTLIENIGLSGTNLNIDIHIPNMTLPINITIPVSYLEPLLNAFNLNNLNVQNKSIIAFATSINIPSINNSFTIEKALGSQVIQIPGTSIPVTEVIISAISPDLSGFIAYLIQKGFVDITVSLGINLTTLVHGTLVTNGSVKNSIFKPIEFINTTTFPMVISAKNLPNGSILIKLTNMTYLITANLVILYRISAPLFHYELSGVVNIPYLPPLNFAVKGKPDCVAGYFRIKPYNITFIQRGLYPGASWSVTLNDVTKSTTGDRIVFYVPAGTFAYTVGSVSGYSASPSSGTIRVSSSNVTYVITFEPLRTTQNARVVTASSTYSTYSAAYDMILIASIAIVIIGGAVAAVIIIRGSRGATG